MPSKLPWQKRPSPSTSKSSPSRRAESNETGVASQQQSQGADPSTHTHPDERPTREQRGSLVRSRSQRFSRHSIADGFSRLTSARQSYVGSTGSQSHLVIEDDPPPSIPSHPDITPFVPPPRTDSVPQLELAVGSPSELNRFFRGDLTAPWVSPSNEDLQALPQPRRSNTTRGQIAEQVTDRAGAGSDPMTTRTASAQGKTSSESAASSSLDRWSQRRLQRLNTEQGFREQRQGTSAQPSYLAAGDHQQYQQQQQQQQQQQTAVAHTQPALSSRAQSDNNPTSQGPSSPPPSSGVSSSPNLSYHDASKLHEPPQATASPADSNTTYQAAHSNNPVARSLPLQRQASSNSHGSQGQTPDGSGVASNDHPQSASRALNRHSIHSNGANTNVNSNSNTTVQVPHIAAKSIPVLQTRTKAPSVQSKEFNLATPHMSTNEEMTDEEVNQLILDHKELREKYNKVKKYYFEKEDQVKALQNSLAHQKIAQSRTSLDDSEYATRFNRLDGLIAQLSFSIRKSWKTVPTWLMGAINKDAIVIGKQEMTAAGRAIVSQWLVEEIFGMYFHPDLDITLSAQLKAMQKNLRRMGPAPTSQEDEEYLTARIVSWRLTTLDGLSEMFRSPQCANNRNELIELLKGQLTSHLRGHLDNPPKSDLEGGVHMIIELAVAMIAHLPLESRDVQIVYFKPSSPLNYDQMKSESGIPSLGVSLADEVSERASVASTHSNVTEDPKAEHHRKRDMLSALTGGGKKRDPKNASSSSLDVSHGHGDKDEPRVRMAVGIAAFVSNRSVLVKAPVFTS